MIPYQCSQTHNGRILTVVVPDLAVPKCSNCGELTFDYEADEQIRRALDAMIQQEKLQKDAPVGTPVGKQPQLQDPTSSSS